jgi:hypothetical protein
MQTLINNMQEHPGNFLKEISAYLSYTPDSANYDLFVLFHDFLLVDIDFAHLDAETVAFEFSKWVTLSHIEKYDNDQEEEVYLDIKPLILRSHLIKNK